MAQASCDSVRLLGHIHGCPTARLVSIYKEKDSNNSIEFSYNTPSIVPALTSLACHCTARCPAWFCYYQEFSLTLLFFSRWYFFPPTTSQQSANMEVSPNVLTYKGMLNQVRWSGHALGSHPAATVFERHAFDSPMCQHLPEATLSSSTSTRQSFNGSHLFNCLVFNSRSS